MTHELLKRWRERADLSQARAGELVGVSQITWSEWERGRSLPSRAHAKKIERLTAGEVTEESWLTAEERAEIQAITAYPLPSQAVA